MTVVAYSPLGHGFLTGVVVSLDKCRSFPVQPSSYGDNEPFQLASLEPQEKVQLTFRIKELLDNVKEFLLVPDRAVH